MVLQNGKWCGVSAIKSLQLTTELQAGKHVQHVMWVSTWMAATKCCCHQSSNKMLSKHEPSESHPRAPPRTANHDITIRGEEIKGCWCNVWQRSSSCFYLDNDALRPLRRPQELTSVNVESDFGHVYSFLAAEDTGRAALTLTEVPTHTELPRFIEGPKRPLICFQRSHVKGSRIKNDVRRVGICSRPTGSCTGQLGEVVVE